MQQGIGLELPLALVDDGQTLTVHVMEEVDLSPWGIEAMLPRGFISDGMSVPRFFWRWVGPRLSKGTIGPSVVHDWLYDTHFMPRGEADEWYRRALVANGYPRAKARAVWLGLRAFGWSHW